MDQREFKVDSRVDKRLRQWAKWWQEIEEGIAGYPQNSSIAMFLDGKTINDSSQKGHVIPIKNEQAWEMDLLINRMGFYNLEYKHVVTLVYLSREPITKLAYELKVSRRTLQTRLQCAKTWLDGALAIVDDL